MSDQDKPYEFSDPRQMETHRRFSILGPGPAAFYRDMCWLMDNPDQLASTSHLMGHLIRELESALCAVVGTIAAKPVKNEKNNSDHKPKVRAILGALEIPEDDLVSQAWVDSCGTLPIEAHRDNLEPPRPVHDDREKLWAQYQEIFHAVLERFEKRYSAIFPFLDELMKVEKPKEEDVQGLLTKVPNNRFTRRYFFEGLNNPAWIAPLTKKDFFRKATRALDSDGQDHTHLLYLERMAALVPEDVVRIFENMGSPNATIVHQYAARAALNMPGPFSARIAQEESAWLEKNDELPSLVARSHGKLIAHLAQNGQSAVSLRLARALLKILPVPWNQEAWVFPEQTEEVEVLELPDLMKDVKHLNLPQAKTKIPDLFGYVLHKNIPALVDAASTEALSLLCDLLSDAIAFSSTAPERDKPKDNLTGWLPGVDQHDKFGAEPLRFPLATAIRDGAVRMLKQDESKLGECVQILEAYGWNVFRRTALFLLMKFPDSASSLAVERLMDENLLHEPDLAHEYFGLANQVFPDLTKPQQNTFLARLREHPPWISADWCPNADDREKYAREWQCKCHHAIREHLRGTHRAHYESLRLDVGEAGTMGFTPLHDGPVHMGPTSPLSPDEIQGMTDDALIQYVQNWEPSAKWGGPSPEGLGNALAAAAERDPARFAGMASRIKSLALTYVCHLFHGLAQAAQKKRCFAWPPILDLAQWTMTEHRRDPSGNAFTRAPEWAWTRTAIASLLAKGLRPGESEIPFELRETVWGVLAPLCEDPEPTPEYEQEYGGTNMDPFDLSLDVTRGAAFHAAMVYALWSRRHLEATGEQPPAGHGWMDEIPEVREVLDRHLDRAVDPSPAIRSVYGRYFPYLTWLDPGWAEQIAHATFGGPEAQDERQKAAWDAYIVYCRPSNDVLDLTEEAHAAAVTDLEGCDPERADSHSPECRLADHLMAYYRCGSLESESRRRPLDEFFENASDVVRAHAIRVLGHRPEPLPDEQAEEVFVRLRALWEKRLSIARQDPEQHAKELSAFGFWFASGTFDEAWALDQLETVLGITGKVDADAEVVQHLAGVAADHLPQALRCLCAMVRGDKERWNIPVWKDSIEALFHRCLDSPDSGLRTEATESANALLAEGHYYFKDLLEEDSPEQP